MEAKINKATKEYEEKITLIDSSIEINESSKRESRRINKKKKALGNYNKESAIWFENTMDMYNNSISKLNIKRQCYVQFKADLDSLLD